MPGAENDEVDGLAEDPAADGPDGARKEPAGSGSAFDCFGLSLIVLRLIRDLSQAEVAERAGIRSNQISRYETGQVLPQLAQVERLSTALGVDPLSLFSFVAQVRALVLTVRGADEATAGVTADVQRLLSKVNLLQLSLGDRLRGILTASLEAAGTGELAGLDPLTELGLTPELLEKMAVRLREQRGGR